MTWINKAKQSNRREHNPNGKVNIVSHILSPDQLATLWGRKPARTEERGAVQINEYSEVEKTHSGRREIRGKVTTIMRERVVEWD